MDGPCAAILVDLPDGHVRDHAGDRDVNARVLQRQTIDGGIAAFDEEEWRQRLVSRESIALRRGIERREQGTESKNEDRAAS
jgi:hypothetical protein